MTVFYHFEVNKPCVVGTGIHICINSSVINQTVNADFNGNNTNNNDNGIFNCMFLNTF